MDFSRRYFKRQTAWWRISRSTQHENNISWRKSMSKSKKNMPSAEEYAELWKDYVLRTYLYMSCGLPSADDTGLSDPFIIFKCASAEVKSRHKAKKIEPWMVPDTRNGYQNSWN